MKTLAVLGSGTMGAGLAEVAALKGFDVILWNRREESLEAALNGIRSRYDRLFAKGKLAQPQRDAALGRLRGASQLEEVKAAQLVVEAVPENFDLKVDLFERLAICGENVVFATNTSSLSVTALAAASGRPDRFAGLHFFNPVPAMRLVEVVRGRATSDATCTAVTELAEQLGKVAIPVRDMPGFVVNRVLMPMINEAAAALEQGVATAADIDRCMKLGCNHPMGPLALADLVGLDVVCAILDSLYEDFGSPHYKPCLELRRRVEAGQLGVKTGQGFYAY